MSASSLHRELVLSDDSVVACGDLTGMMYSVIYTLVTPILSDSFGFTVEYTSHFYLGVSLAFFASSLIYSE